MSSEISPGAVSEDDEIHALIETLIETERRLEEITHGEVDAIVGRDGRPFLLGRAQEQLRHREAGRQAAILNALPAHIALLNTEGVIILVNEAWRQFADANIFHAPGHAVGLNYLAVCDRAQGEYSAEAHQVAAGIRAVMGGVKRDFSIEYPCHSPIDQRWFQLMVTPLADDHSNGVVVMHLNITERRQAEETVRASEANMADAQRIAHFGSWEASLTNLTDLSANTLRWSDEMFRIAGYEPGSVPINTDFFFKLVPVDEHEPIREAVAKAIRERGEYSIVHRLLRQDDTTRVVRETGKIFFDETTGQPLKIIGSAHDITERKQAEAALQDKQAELQVILDTVPAMIFYKDRQHRFLRVNAAAVRAHGRPAQDFVGKTDAELGLPQAEHYVRDEEEIAATGQPKRNITEPVFTGTGTRWFQTDKFPTRDATGSINGFIGISMDITERKRFEAALKASEQRYHSLFENMLEGYAYCRTHFEQDQLRDFTYVEVNKAFEQLTGLKDIVGKKISEVIPGFYKTNRGVFEVYHRVAWTGQPEKFEVFVERLGVWLSITAYSSDREHFVAIFDNITDRKLAEGILRERDERLRVALSASGAGTFRWDFRTNALDWDESLDALFGLPRGQTVQSLEAFVAAVHPDDRSRVIERCERCMREGADFTMEFRVLWPDGSLHWLDDRGKTFLDAAGKPLYMTGACVDITERKRAAAELAEFSQRTERRERMLSTALASMTDFAQIYDSEGRFLFANQPLLDLWGITLEAVLGKNFHDLGYPSELAVRLQTELQEVFETRRSITGETQFTNAAGQAGWYEYIFSPAAGVDGVVDFVVGSTRDITERKNAENTLRQNQKHLRGLIDGMGPAMFVGLLTTEGILIEVNKAPLLAAGLKLEDVLGKPFAETPWWSYSPAAQQQLREAIMRAARGEASRYDVRAQGANNEIIDIDFSLQPLRDEPAE